MVIGRAGDLGHHATKLVTQEHKVELVHVTILHPKMMATHVLEVVLKPKVVIPRLVVSTIYV